MAAPTTLTVPIILQCAELCEGYSAQSRATKNALYGGVINELMPEKIYLLRRSIQYQYDIDPTNPTLLGSANYLWSLLVYGYRALAALGQGGGEVIIVVNGGTVVSITSQVVQLVVGDASQANPSGSPTPNAGDTVVTLNYKVLPDSENIFYAGVVVPKYNASDFWYVPNYGSTTTTYTFRDALQDGFALKFDFLKIVSEGSGGGTGTGNGLQAVFVTAPTTQDTLTVAELGTFVSITANNSTNYPPEVTQSGTDLNLANIGGAIAGTVYLVIYYPQSS